VTRRFAAEFAASRIALLGLALLSLVLLAALFAPWISPQDPYDLARLELLDSRLPPLAHSAAGAIHWLGTDDQGRDMLSAILTSSHQRRRRLRKHDSRPCHRRKPGPRGGLVRRLLDALLMRLADLQLSFPSILIALVLLAVLGQGLDKIIVALVAVQWAYYAARARRRLIERRKEYIDARVALAFSNTRIIFRHLLPNCAPPIIVLATVQVAAAITLEATLSFLGSGCRSPNPSLGLLISNGFNYPALRPLLDQRLPRNCACCSRRQHQSGRRRLRDVLDPHKPR